MNELSHLAKELDLERLRTRLQEMSDAELLRFAKAARYICSPRANRERPAREEFVILLEESLAEWRRQGLGKA
jgi:hypothetical protein